MVTMIIMRIHTDSPIIDKLGGNVALANIFDVTSQYVTKWRKHGIPKPYRMYLELRFPDAFRADRCQEEAA